jgi:TonB-linked SusC/RagA family outer membrane protein
MKISLILLFAGMLNAMAGTSYSQSARVSLNLKNASVEDVLNEIEKKSEFFFLFNQKLVDVNRKVDLVADNKPIKEILASLFDKQDVDYVVLDRQIILSPKEDSKAIEDLQQTLKITGSVIDASTGEALPGVNVVIEGTTNGTVTDLNGNYSIEINKVDASLSFSFLGYINQKIEVKDQNKIDVKLAPDVQKLDEIVVIGYGVQKKSLVTAAIAKIDSKDMENVVASNFEGALQGKTSGVTVTQNSGAPGSDLAIKIRGNGSDGSTNPLYIVDGVATGGMNYLEPSDIESIEVLKDASAAAIYGANGGNGVIIITTKKGKKGNSQIEYSYSHGVQNATKLPSAMTGPEYRQYFMEAANWENPKAINKSGNYKIFSNSDSVQNTNWVKQVFQSAPMDEHKINFSGGGDKSTYFVSVAYLNQNGIVGGSKNNFTRYSFRANVNSDLKSWFSIGSDISYTRTKQNNLNTENEYGGIINDAITYQPNIPVFTDTSHIPMNLRPFWNQKNGQYYSQSGITTGEAWNPMAQIDYSNNKQTNDKIFANLHADFSPIKGLKFTSRIYVDYAYQLHDIYNGYTIYGTAPITADSLTNLNESWDRWYTYGIQNQGQYELRLGDHYIQFMVGQEYSNYSHYWLSYTGFGIPYANVQYAYPATTNWRMHSGQNSINDESTSPEAEIAASYFGRFMYNYKEKYILQGSIRRDGSSKFGSENPWGTFPAFSAGWAINKEDFFVDNSQLMAISNLKLRASYGINGSKNNMPWFPAVAAMIPVYYNDNSGANIEKGLYPGITSAGLKWEQSVQSNVGIDMGFFRNSLTATVEWFNKFTTDQLVPNSNQPADLGFNAAGTINSGKIQNRGWEFDIAYHNNFGEFKYNLSFNASYVQNKVLDYISAGKDGANIGQLGVVNRYEIGQPVWFFKGYQAIGIFQDTAQINHYGSKLNGKFVKYQPAAKPGDVKFADVNNDGVIDSKDETYLGKPMPDWTYGYNLDGEYKGLELSLFFQGVTGNQIYWAGYRSDRQEYNKAAVWFNDRWTGPGSSNFYPRATDNDANQNFRVSSLNVFNGDYLRLKNLTLSYTIPTQWTSKLFVSKLRIYYTGTNLFTSTKYPGTDPEVGYYDTNNNYSYGIDKGLYPASKINTVGINVTF